jgi:hypothetical protein
MSLRGVLLRSLAMGSDMSAAADMMSVERCARWHGCGLGTGFSRRGLGHLVK